MNFTYLQQEQIIILLCPATTVQTSRWDSPHVAVQYYPCLVLSYLILSYLVEQMDTISLRTARALFVLLSSASVSQSNGTTEGVENSAGSVVTSSVRANAGMALSAKAKAVASVILTLATRSLLLISSIIGLYFNFDIKRILI